MWEKSGVMRRAGMIKGKIEMINTVFIYEIFKYKKSRIVRGKQYIFFSVALLSPMVEQLNFSYKLKYYSKINKYYCYHGRFH